MTAWAKLLLNSFAIASSTAWVHLISQKAQLPVDLISADLDEVLLDVSIPDELVITSITEGVINVGIIIDGVLIAIEQTDDVDIDMTSIDTNITLSDSETGITVSDSTVGVDIK